MRPEERDPAYLLDMLEAAEGAVRFTEELSLDGFLAEDGEMTRLAVERKLEILGEAARRVSEEFRRQHPRVPWKDIVGLRNVISHQYDKVNYEELFGIVQKRVPDLIAVLKPLIPPLPDPGE